MSILLQSPPFAALQERPLHCEIISTRAQLEALLPQWDDLLQNGIPHTIFQSSGWIKCLLEEPGLQLRTPVVYDGERLIGILPATLDGSRLRMLGYPYSDYNDVLCADQDGPVVLALSLQALFGRDDWTECEFDQLPSQGRLARYLRKLPEGLHGDVQSVYRTACPVTVSAPPAAGLIAPERLRSLKKRRKRLERAGNLVFRHVESRDEMREKLPILFHQHGTRMEARGAKSRLLEERARRLLLSCAQHMDPQRELRFSVLELDGRVIACHLGFELGDTFYYYVTGFDTAAASYSPSDVLLGALLEHAAGRGIQQFDFGIGGETYKRRYANRIRENLTLYVNRTARSLPASMRRTVVGRLRQYMETAEQRAFEEQAPPPPALRLLQAGMRARAKFAASWRGRRAA
jgi:CelD/BcsL family acetyltransferase involved in cellulose biosynthesis